MLPIRATLEDARKLCGYLASKPTGATPSEARKVLGAGHLDSRKVSALKRWGLITQDGERMKLSDAGRRLAKDPAEAGQRVFRETISRLGPYKAALERAHYDGEASLPTRDVAAYWHDNFRDEVGGSDDVLNDQAVCFFQAVEGAALGKLVVGRRGASTRLDLTLAEVAKFVGSSEASAPAIESESVVSVDDDAPDELSTAATSRASLSALHNVDRRRVFITHGKNKKILDQLKEIVKYGKLEPVVAEEHETTSKPLPDKVMDDMRTCAAGIIHVASERVLFDADHQEVKLLNENVLIEIGGALALYGKNFILLVEDGVKLPSNLAGLYECRYVGDKLDGDATMKLLKAFNAFA